MPGKHCPNGNKTLEWSGLRTALISSSHLWLSEATILRLSSSLLPHYHPGFEHHINHQEQEHPGDTQSLHMGEIRTWKRRPADLHGIQAGWSCVTGQSSSNLLVDSKVEGICALAFKFLQEILATLFDAGCSNKSNSQKYKWFLRTVHTVLPAFLACWMDCWH